MRLSDVKFFRSVGLWSKDLIIDEKPEIVFVGRSNVGKSSIMNSLFEKKDLVKTSSRAGKTQLANLFRIDNKYYMTDLPGYGFARLGKNLKEELDGLISWYIEEKQEFLKRVVILIDSRLGAQEVDIEMYKYLLDMGVPIVIVLSKTDKISKWELGNMIQKTKNHFFWQEIIPVSSLKKTWIKELTKILKADLLEK